MLRIGRTLLVAAILSTSWQTYLHGELVVDSWILGTGVRDSAPGSTDYDFDFTELVQNPFEGTHTSMLGNSHSDVLYDVGWSGDSAYFSAYPNHFLQDILGTTNSGGHIYFTPAVDSIVTGYGSWQFAWPNSAHGDTHVSLYILDPLAEDDDFVVLEAGGYGGNEGLGPPYGNFTIQDSGLLLAGREYEIHYEADVYFYTALPAGTHADASGEIHFTITPVPEPGALALLAPTLLLALRRQAR